MMNKILILGSGVTGQALTKWCTKHNVDYTLVDNTKTPPFINWEEYTQVVKSPSIPFHDPLIKVAIQHNLPILGDLAFFANPNHAKVIGITGTNGKSTVCAMISHMLATAGLPHALGGNFGTPVTDLQILPESGVYVLELSSYQLETLPTNFTYNKPHDGNVFDIGILLNLDEDHIDHHLTMETYAEAKTELLKFSKQKIIATDDPWTEKIASQYPSITLSTKPSEGHFVKGIELWKGNTKEAELPITMGQHDILNGAVVWIVGKILQISPSAILKSLETYVPLPHRQQHIYTIGKVKFINDSKATNVHAVISSLKRFSQEPIHLIMGGGSKI